MVDFIQIDCFFQCICICVPNCLHWQFFFSTFHLGGACTTFRGWWTRVLHWGDATVHARGISRELALWSSLWKSLSTVSAHFSFHGATAYPTAACPRCELDLFCAWTLHGSVWPQPIWNIAWVCNFRDLCSVATSNVRTTKNVNMPPHPTPPPHPRVSGMLRNDESVGLLEALTPKTWGFITTKNKIKQVCPINPPIIQQ